MNNLKNNTAQLAIVNVGLSSRVNLLSTCKPAVLTNQLPGRNAVRRFLKMTEFFGGIPLVEIDQQILQIILIEFCSAPAAWHPEAVASPRHRRQSRGVGRSRPPKFWAGRMVVAGVVEIVDGS